MKIGLFGFGTVGQGLYQLIEGTGYGAGSISKIAVRDKQKPRTAPAELFTYNAADILESDEIDTVVEAIDDADVAYGIVKRALDGGKNVITANKKLVASHLEELTQKAKDNKVIFRYEAAVGGAIPIVDTIDNYFGQEPLSSVRGILNGTSNYILTRIVRDQLEYKPALKQAQDLGFAEADPTADVGGFDPKYKIIILALHTFGVLLKPEEVLNAGIQRLQPEDFQYAKERGWKIKLVPHLGLVDDKVVAYVLPEFVKPTDRLFHVDDEFNGVMLEAAYAGTQFFYGRGAGSHPTASAVLSDIDRTVLRQGYKLSKQKAPKALLDDNKLLIEVYVRYTNDAIKKVLPFVSISEGFFSTEYNQVTGFISLKDLKAVAHLLHRERASLIATGQRKGVSGF
ncbi:MAG: homoserine dehydrogenase [Flavobacteriales bacterium]